MAKQKILDRLTRDAIAAEKAGMSYGKYKALHPHTPEEYVDPQKEAQEKVITKACPICGRTFICSKQGTHKKYCSDICYRAADNDRKLGRLAPLQCVWCGGDIPRGSHRTRYCCDDCYHANQAHKKAERMKKKHGNN